ncbi:MAG TPA: hypothetical protein VGN88_11145 [Phycisphaerae bacterium]|jgi:hypothetical protein
MNITGKWKGDYTFEETTEGGERKVLGTTVTFTMELKQGFLSSVSGTVQDDPRAGFPEAGTIKGKLKGNILSFEKIQPLMRLVHEPTRMTVEELAERHKVVMDTKIRHPKIRHIGDISADGNSIEGTWLSPEQSIEIPGSYQSVQLPKLAGSFKMSRDTTSA